MLIGCGSGSMEGTAGAHVVASVRPQRQVELRMWSRLLVYVGMVELGRWEVKDAAGLAEGLFGWGCDGGGRGDG